MMKKILEETKNKNLHVSNVGRFNKFGTKIIFISLYFSSGTQIKLCTLKNASTATKAFVFVAPLRFPRDPFLFPRH